MHLVVAGGLRIDYVITAHGEVRVRQIGGNAVYAAVGARSWIKEVQLLAKAGDNFPETWLVQLAKQGLRTDGVRRVPGWQEMRTFYAYLDEQTRVDRDPGVHFARVGHPLPADLEGYVNSVVGQTAEANSPMTLWADDISRSMAGCDTVHIAPIGFSSQNSLVTQFRQRGVTQITVDPGEDTHTDQRRAQVRQMCGSIDAFMPSENEVRLLLGDRDSREAAEILANWGPSVVAIKRGPHGCLLYERDARRFTSIPAFPARVVDVTGAGDSFCGGFAVGLKQSGDPRTAALMGTVSASFAVETYGALAGLEVESKRASERLEFLRQRVSG
ncbi:MAG: carbohydrate kinase family protein [Actinomycetota bacterium]